MIRLMKYAEQPVAKWQGGETRELFMYPGVEGEPSVFEVTSSTMEYPETEYSIFAGYQRILMVIEGETTLCHQDGESAKLKKYDYHVFSGDEQIWSKGLATDYELIIKKGNLGSMSLIKSKESRIYIEKNQDFELVYAGFYCDGEGCELEVAGKRYELKKGDHLSIILDEPTEVLITDNAGVVINSTIQFNPAE